jgi:hypothetical protein
MRRFVIFLFSTTFIFGLLGAGWILRYRPMPELGSVSGQLWVWDNWTHRVCFGGYSRSIKCANSIAMATTTAEVTASAETIINSIKTQDHETPDEPEFVQFLTSRGFSDGEIALYLFSLRDRMIASGAPKDQVTAYFLPVFRRLENDARKAN